MSRVLLIVFLFILPVFHLGCSSDEGPVCGDTVCNSNEVCEDGQCVLALIIEPAEEELGCRDDGDCSRNEVCTQEDSDPPSSCIPRLPCDYNRDCQLGLTCHEDGLCR